MNAYIRPATSEDAPSIAGVFASSISGLTGEHYSDLQRKVWIERFSRERIELSIAEHEYWVAEFGNEVVAFVSLRADAAELDSCYVAPRAARQGIGGKLCRRVEDRAKELGLTELRLMASLNAVPFYESQGFVVEQSCSKSLDGVAMPCIRMSKRL